MNRSTLAVWALLAALLIGGGRPGRAQANAPQANAPQANAAQTVTTQGPPDVLLIVSQRPRGGDLLDLTYGKTVPRDQVRRDLAALSRETGWALSAPKITDATPAVRPSQHYAIGPMTGAEFTTPLAVQAETHSLPISAIASAFRGYRRVAAVFFTAPGFSFQGPRQYADKNVRVTLAGGGTSYTCQIEILDPNFTRLDLPLSQPSPGPPAGPRLPVLLGVVGAAAGVALLVYFVLARLTGRSAPVTGPPPTDQTRPTEEERKTPA